MTTTAVNGWTVTEIGRSVMGAPIERWALAGSRPDRLLVAGIHGEEQLTSVLARRLIDTVPPDGSWAVIPCANPDGAARGTRQNARGVDLNRNFPSVDWTAGATPSFFPGERERTDDRRTNLSSTGATAGSEPETQALAAAITTQAPRLVLDLHAPLEAVIDLNPRGLAAASRLAAAARMPIRTAEPGAIPGSLLRWARERGIPTLVYELGDESLGAIMARHLPALAAFMREAGSS